MSAAPKMCDNPCQTCKKEGLPLLLTRYALIPKDSGGPTLTGQLKDPSLDKVPLGTNEHYGLRLLRSGYVYVFDEKHKLWDEYFVTQDGILSKLPRRPLAKVPYRQPAPQPVQPPPKHAMSAPGTPAPVSTSLADLLKPTQPVATEFRCARNGAAPLAGVITVPATATKIWLAFSNVEWTTEVMRQHLSEDHRKRHMRCIIVSGGKVAPQPGTAPFKELTKHIPEFALPPLTGKRRFAEWSPHHFNSRQEGTERLLQAVDIAYPMGGAAIVALHDPIGLLQEFAGLMLLRKGTYMEDPVRAAPLFAASTIESLEAQVKAQARLTEIVSSESLAEDAESTMADYNPSAMAAGVLPSNPWAAQQIRASLTPASLERVAAARWKTYTHKVRGTGSARFDADGAKEWLKRHRADTLVFDAKQVLPLARAHAAWMQTDCIKEHMSCTHDRSDNASGAAYTAALLAAMEHTWDVMPCYDLYLNWIKQGDTTSRNLLMRAISLNQDDLAEAISKADKPALDSRAFPSDAVFAGLASHFSKLSDEARGVHAKLMAGLSGVAIKYWDEFQSGKVSPAFAAAMSGASGKQIVRLPLIGTRSQLIEAYVTQISRLNPNMVINQNQLRQAVAAQIRLMQMQGINLGQPRKLAWFILLDAESARAVLDQAKASRLRGQALADELVKATMRSPQAIRTLEQSAIASMARASQRALAATVVGAVLMGWNYSKLEEDLSKGMSHELGEASVKLWAGRFAVGGFVSEQLGKRLQASEQHHLRNAKGLNWAAWGGRLVRWGGRVSLVSGVFVGLWDASKAPEEFKKGDVAMGSALLLGGAAAATLAAYSFFAATFGPAGWILLAVVLIATLWIESNKDTKLHEWLLRCHFGSADKGDRYEHFAKQLSEYKIAVQ